MSRMGVCYSYPNCVSSFPFHCTMRKVKPLSKGEQRSSDTIQREKQRRGARDASRFHSRLHFSPPRYFLSHHQVSPYFPSPFWGSNVAINRYTQWSWSRINFSHISFVENRKCFLNWLENLRNRLCGVNNSRCVEGVRETLDEKAEVRRISAILYSWIYNPHRLFKKNFDRWIWRKEAKFPSTYISTPQFLSVPFLHVLICTFLFASLRLPSTIANITPALRILAKLEPPRVTGMVHLSVVQAPE